jgi:flagellar hook-length control protein FliK
MTSLSSTPLQGLGGSKHAAAKGQAGLTSFGSTEGQPSFSALLRDSAIAPKPQPPAAPSPAPAPAPAPAPHAQAAPAEASNAEGKSALTRQQQDRLQQNRQAQQAKPAADSRKHAEGAKASDKNTDAATRADTTADPASSADSDLDGEDAALSEGEDRTALPASALPWQAIIPALRGDEGGKAGIKNAKTGEELSLPVGAGRRADASAGTQGGRTGKAAEAALSLGAADAATQSAELARNGSEAADTSFASLLQQQQGKPSAASAGSGMEALLASRQAAAPELPSGPSPAEAPTAVPLSQPLHEPSFAPEMAARLSLLAADGVQQAELHLNPSEMGPVSVQIIVDGQQAQISFHSDLAETRAVLEASLPDLAAALRDSGLTLSGGGVFQQAREQAQPEAGQHGSDRRRGSTAPVGSSDSVETGPKAGAAAPQRNRGVLDMYA